MGYVISQWWFYVMSQWWHVYQLSWDLSSNFSTSNIFFVFRIDTLQNFLQMFIEPLDFNTTRMINYSNYCIWSQSQYCSFLSSINTHLICTLVWRSSLIMNLLFSFINTDTPHFLLSAIMWSLLLYARLKNGRIMLWQCLSVRPSVRPSEFSWLFFNVLWDINLKLGICIQ